jgi:4'-phosphopantetheinyl transferase
MSDPALWATPANHPALGEGELHIWRARLDLDVQELERLRPALNDAELDRAARFHFSRDRDHFTACRGILRDLLAGYLGSSSTSVEFEYGAYGKPSVRSDTSDVRIRFNVSHSHGMCVLAFSRDREVGIDVEAMRAEFTGEEIAERYFSTQELAELRSLPAAIRTQAFFLCWTRKEAYIKARGLGLQIPLDSFSVSLTPDAPALLASVDAARWNLRSFEAWPNFAAAIVEEGFPSPEVYWQWTPGRR